jgi:hypothetical protein
MYEKARMIRKLEEQYEEEKREIHNKLQAIDEQLRFFRRETEEIVDQVSDLTRKDSPDLTALNWQLMEIDESVYQEGERCYAQLEEDQRELRRTLERGLEQIAEEERLAAKDLEKTSKKLEYF